MSAIDVSLSICCLKVVGVMAVLTDCYMGKNMKEIVTTNLLSWVLYLQTAEKRDVKIFYTEPKKELSNLVPHAFVWGEKGKTMDFSETMGRTKKVLSHTVFSRIA